MIVPVQVAVGEVAAVSLFGVSGVRSQRPPPFSGSRCRLLLGCVGGVGDLILGVLVLALGVVGDIVRPEGPVIVIGARAGSSFFALLAILWTLQLVLNSFSVMNGRAARVALLA